MKPKSCDQCGKSFGIFRWRWPCVTCGAIRCSACLTKAEGPPVLRRMQILTAKSTEKPKDPSDGDVALATLLASVRVAPTAPASDEERWALFADGDHCRACNEKHVLPILARYVDADARAFEIQTWPKTYQGRTPEDPAGPWTIVSSRDHWDRDAARRDLQVLAAYAGMHVVTGVTYTKHRHEVVWYVQRGNKSHRRSRWETGWTAMGAAATRRAGR